MTELLFLLLPVAAAYGWFYGRNSLRQESLKQKASVARNLSSGLNFLLTDQEDKAIEQLLTLMEMDAATLDTYLALATLFRRRGDLTKAIRIHEKLLQLKNPKSVVLTLQFELAADYYAAGFYDRAEALYEELVTQHPQQDDILRQLFLLYSSTHEWGKIERYLSFVYQSKNKSLRRMAANLCCEQQGVREHEPRLRQIIRHFPDAIRPRLLLAELLSKSSVPPHDEIRSIYQALLLEKPRWTAEILPLWMATAPAAEHVVDVLNKLVTEHRNISAFIALAEHLQQQQPKQASDLLLTQLQQQPNIRLFIAYLRLQALLEPEQANAFHHTRQLVQHYLDSKPLYSCKQCGYASKKHYWLCPSCHQWETVEPLDGIDGR
jgi:lipopolysaccharide biosynthesis regulator YciM